MTYQHMAAYVLLITSIGLVGSSPAQPANASGEQEPLIQLAAVQMTLELDDFWTREGFEARIDQLMKRVQSKLDPHWPALVVFPEDVGLLLVLQGMEQRLAGTHTIAEAIEKATRAHLLPVLWTRLRRGVSWVPALYLYRHQMIAETYFEVFSAAAKRHQVYLVAGSVILPPYPIRNGTVQWQRPLEYQVHNTAYLFGPDGQVIGKQDKMHLIELEEEAALDLTAGNPDTLTVFETAVGRIGIAICLDAFRDEVIEALTAQGAEILVQPSANPAPWHEEQQLEWMQSAHQRTVVEKQFVYGVNPMMNGPLWDIAFFGQSSIVGGHTACDSAKGYSALQSEPGFLALAETDAKEEIIVVAMPHPRP